MCPNPKKVAVTVGIVCMGFFAVTSAQQPAFPGAEGFGQFALGGRSGTVYHVTNLSDAGSGSFRDAVSAANRTIVFDVSGTINLSSALCITKSNLTIAGQTAPGDGVSTMGWMTEVKARNVIVRFLHCRPGDTNCPSSMDDDAFHFDAGASNCIADHVTASWSLDEALSTSHSTNITVQWCMIALPLNHSCHDEGSGIQNHGYGSLIRYDAGGITYHHNLYAHCLSRNPRGPSDRLRLDFVNNIVFNWGIFAGYNEDDASKDGNPAAYTNSANYVGNYLIAGANTTQNPPLVFRNGVTNLLACTQLYQTNNFIDGNKNGVLDGAEVGWSAFGNRPGGKFTTNFTRFPFPQVTTDDPKAAYVRVLSTVGASLVRDTVDSGVVSNVINQNGVIIDSQTQVGGWPTLVSLPAPLDTDQDGMPDFWEAALGSSTNNAVDRNDLMPDGYTRLEWYLNWLAGPHARCTNSSVDVELRQYTAGLVSPTFSVNSASNGTVSLLGDGHTARFTPSLSGLASFLFAASGSPASLTGTVSVLATVVPPTANLTASPTNGVEPLMVTFTDTSTGATPLNLSWDLGDSTITNTAGGASFTHPYSAGFYTVTLTASNSAGTSTLASNSLIRVITALQVWQLQYFGCTNCAAAGPDADPDGDGMSNTNEFLAGTSPTNSTSALKIVSTIRQSTNVVITWTTTGGFTNVVQGTAGNVIGGFATNFTDLSGLVIISGSGDQTTNYIDSSGATNSPSRYYRIRLVP